MINFKETKTYKFTRSIGILFASIVLFMFLVGSKNITVWDSESSGIAFLFATLSLVSIAIAPIFLIITIVLFYNDKKTYQTFNYSNINFIDKTVIIMAILIPLLIIMAKFVS